MAKAHRVDGFTRLDSTYAGKQMPPQIVENEGHDFMVVHADGFTTGYVQMTDNTLVPVVTTWASPSRGQPFGMALSFTPDDEMFDLIINSLTAMRDKRRAEAKEQAEAALRKAAGR